MIVRLSGKYMKVLECRVCEDVFGLHGDKIPRLLFCGHTLCHACLSRLPTADGFISVLAFEAIFTRM
jgi:hypothetical protein